jgi:hypothetical protein
MVFRMAERLMTRLEFFEIDALDAALARAAELRADVTQ